MTSRKRISEILVDNHQMTKDNAAQIFALMQAGRTGKSEQELILEREFAAEKDIAREMYLELPGITSGSEMLSSCPRKS